VSTSTIVEEAVEGYNEHKGEDNAEVQRVLELPLPKKYQHFMKDLRFDYISMKDTTGKFKHHYSSSYSATYTPAVTKTIRLAQELADISTALPVEHTNAIYVRCDKERVDFMQALIMGSNGTPYGHGAYLFDIHFEDSYPSVSPKVNLTTTGHGKVRFNPNLYACGKVCLSLLGTWRGNATENWDPKVSTLLQVLVSIQSIIMAEEVYFNEPGFEHEQGTEEGDRKNEAYSNIVRYCNIKYAMIDNIRNPPKGFETVIRRHFYLKKDEILEECRKWVKYATKREASYNGLINDHNNNWCT
jgi:ubiquitin-protein ligase